jgi:hypothetical protein
MTDKSWANINWQPIGSLSLIRSMVDGLLDETEKQHANLESCRSKPHVLDDYTVDRVIKVYTDLRLYEEQLCRCKKLELDRFQRREVERLAAQVPKDSGAHQGNPRPGGGVEERHDRNRPARAAATWNCPAPTSARAPACSPATAGPTSASPWARPGTCSTTSSD